MKQHSIFIVKSFFIFIFSMATTSLLTAILWLDIIFLDNSVSEFSATEFLQVLLLACIIVLFSYYAYIEPTNRSCCVLIAGFFACCLVRELDFLFDMIFHGSWFYFTLPIASGCIAYAYNDRNKSVYALSKYCETKSFIVMSCGLLVVLCFSRIIGMKWIWTALLKDNFSRVVKNVAEETTELFGYMLCLHAAILYKLESVKKQKQSTSR